MTPQEYEVLVQKFENDVQKRSRLMRFFACSGSDDECGILEWFSG